MKDKIKQTFSKKIYKKTKKPSGYKKSMVTLGIFSFFESFISPIPPDIIMIPFMKTNPNKCFITAFVASISSILGGIVGYAVGAILFSTVGIYLINLYGLAESFNKIQSGFFEYGFWIILLKGITPIPFKLVTITSGVLHFNILQFIIASSISRLTRFYIPATLFFIFKEKVISFMDKHAKLSIILITSIAIISIFIVFLI